MCSQPLNSTYDETRSLSIRVKGTKIDTTQEPDDFSNQLIDHVCECLECLMTVIKQRTSLVEAGCPGFLSLLVAAQKYPDSARSPLMNVHLTEDTIEEYCFNRLTFIEVKVLEGHLAVCRDCNRRIEHRKRFVHLIKAAFRQRTKGRAEVATGIFAFNEATGQTAELDVSLLAL